VRLISRHRAHLDRLANALLEKETLDRPEIDSLLEGLEPESDASGMIGVALPSDDDVVHANGNGSGTADRLRMPEPVMRTEKPEQPA
jgi:hypothetical protein